MESMMAAILDDRTSTYNAWSDQSSMFTDINWQRGRCVPSDHVKANAAPQLGILEVDHATHPGATYPFRAPNRSFNSLGLLQEPVECLLNLCFNTLLRHIAGVHSFAGLFLYP